MVQVFAGPALYLHTGSTAAGGAEFPDAGHGTLRCETAAREAIRCILYNAE